MCIYCNFSDVQKMKDDADRHSLKKMLNLCDDECSLNEDILFSRSILHAAFLVQNFQKTLFASFQLAVSSVHSNQTFIHHKHAPKDASVTYLASLLSVKMGFNILIVNQGFRHEHNP